MRLALATACVAVSIVAAAPATGMPAASSTSYAPSEMRAQSVPKLYAWALAFRVDYAGVSRLRYHGPIVSRVAPGSYRFDVWAQPNLVFHLYGPGVDRRTAFSSTTGTYVFARWRVRLREGVYRYRAEGVLAKAAASDGLRVAGSFRVR